MTQGSVGLCSICVDLNFGVTSVGTSVVGQIGQTTFYQLLKNVGKVKSSKQINKKHFQNNSNEIDL